MADLPRLPPAQEHRIAKAACALGPRTGRRLFGAPPRIDGQVLARDTQALLALARASGEENFYAGMTVDDARAKAVYKASVIDPRPKIAMAEVRDLAVPGPGGPLGARLYRPHLPASPEAAEPLPLLLYFHGGGWVIGDLDTHDSVCRFLGAAAGIAVLAIDYRLAPEHPFPASVDDATTALSWVLAHAEELGADPARVAVGGDSAGGALAAGAGILARDGGGPAPAMQLLIYPVTKAVGTTRSRELFAKGFLLTRADTEAFEAAYVPGGVESVTDERIHMLERGDLRGVAPAYIATAGFDPLRDEGEEFGQRLREAGVQTAVRRHSGLVHSFANHTGVSPTARAAMLEAAGALRMGLAPAS
jgi:acetyl esterase